MKTQQPAIPVEITLGGPLGGLQAGSVEEQACHRVGSLAADLGIPGEVHVSVGTRDDAGATAVAIAVHGAPVEYARSLEHQVLVLHRRLRAPVAAADGGTVGADGADGAGLPSWREQLEADEGDTVSAVVELTGHAIAASACSLLGPEQVPAWLERAAMTPRDGIADVLATLLDLGLGVGDHERMARLLSEVSDDSAADAAEHLIEAMRPSALEVRIEPGYLEEITTTGFDANPDIFPFVRDNLYTDLGLRLPSLRLIPDAGMAPRCFAIRVNDVTTAPVVGVPPGMCLVNALATQLSAIAPEAQSALNPGTGTESAYVPAPLRDQLELRGYTIWDPLGHLALSLAETARTHARGLVDRGVVGLELDRFAQLQPLLAQSALAILPVNRVTRLLRSLLDERVPVRDLRGLLQGLVDKAATSGLPGSDDELLVVARQVRTALIAEKAMQWGSIRAFLLEPSLSAGIVAAEDGTASRARASLVTALDAQLAALPPGTLPPVLLTTADARLPVRRAIRNGWPRLTVLAHEDLDPMINVQPLARLASADSRR